MIRQVFGVSAASFAIAAGIAAAPATASPGTYCGISSAGASVYAGNSGTTCGFALNTAEAYHANGSGTFSVTSPATGVTYLMFCSDAAVCHGGNNALVYLRP